MNKLCSKSNGFPYSHHIVLVSAWLVSDLAGAVSGLTGLTFILVDTLFSSSVPFDHMESAESRHPVDL